MNSENEQLKRRPISSEKKNKKKRKKKLVLVILLLLIIGIISYAYWQYNKGFNLAKDSEEAVEPDVNFIGDDFDEEVENFLIIGIDSRGEANSRSDTMMILSWNHKTDEMKLASFMRDIYANIPGYGYYKLNAAYAFGETNLLKETLNSMFEIPIHHYATVDFKSFETMIDILAPDGVEINVQKDMSEKIGVELKQGVQQLNGKELLGYSRFRADAEGDFGRVGRQQEVISALKNQVLTLGNIKNMPKFVGAAQGYISTDLAKTEQLKRVVNAVSSGTNTIETMTIPAEGTYSFNNNTHAGAVIEIDLQQNKQILHEFFNN